MTFGEGKNLTGDVSEPSDEPTLALGLERQDLPSIIQELLGKDAYYAELLSGRIKLGQQIDQVPYIMLDLKIVPREDIAADTLVDRVSCMVDIVESISEAGYRVFPIIDLSGLSGAHVRHIKSLSADTGVKRMQSVLKLQAIIKPNSTSTLAKAAASIVGLFAQVFGTMAGSAIKLVDTADAAWEELETQVDQRQLFAGTSDNTEA